MNTDKTGEPESILEDGLAEAVARWRLGDTGSQRLDETVTGQHRPEKCRRATPPGSAHDKEPRGIRFSACAAKPHTTKNATSVKTLV